MFREELIGRRIRHLRLERGLTQELVARAADLSTGYLSKIESSGNPPPVPTLVKIAKALGVGIGDLFADQEVDTKMVIVRASEREALEHKGSWFEPLAFQFANRHMEPFLMRIPTEAGPVEERDRPGEGFMFILKGRVRVQMEGIEDEMSEGDSAYYTLGLPSTLESLDGEAVAIHVAWVPKKTGKAPDSP